MRIELKCKCGASAVFEDNKGVYINDGGKPDERGRKFLIEVRADEWQERHNACLNMPKNK